MSPVTTDRRRRAAARWLLAAALTGLAACASYGPAQLRVGQSADEVTRAMGTPTALYALPGGGQRVEYARGPFGRETYMVDLDAGGHVTGWRQVLTEAHFARLPQDLTRDQLLMLLGTPSERQSIGWQHRTLWAWRYPTNDCLWFTASLDDATQRVVDTGYGIDPRCDAGNGRDRR